jgi:hypothetical protein
LSIGESLVVVDLGRNPSGREAVMGKKKSSLVDRTISLSDKLIDLAMQEILAGRVTYEEAVAAVEMFSSMMNVAHYDLPARCFSNLNTIWDEITSTILADKLLKLKVKAQNTSAKDR